MIVCTKCHEQRPTEAFSRSSTRRTGLSAWCKQCVRGQERARKARDPEAFRARQAGYSRTYAERHRDRQRARDRQRPWDAKRRAAEALRNAAEPERYILKAMKQRCRNPRNAFFPDYGGRGIKVSPAFDGPNGFATFVAEVGKRPGPDYSIERIKNELGYEPGNIRWATGREQQRNKRSNRILTAFGKSQALCDWAEETGIDSALIRARIDRLGWPIEKALSTQPRAT